jgi:glycosyltransferase involved in cell wall biosynthesis
MQKILIGIPCYNEEQSIEACLHSIKANTSNSISYDFEILVVNDGSTDSSKILIEELKDSVGVISSVVNNGLSEVFNTLMNYTSKHNFDYLVIFDADGQYPAEDIIDLLDFTIKNKSDITVGTRNFRNNKVFSRYKNLLQIIGSAIIGKIIGFKISDISSGFRVYSNKASHILFSSNAFTYTVETLFQAKFSDLKIKQFELTEFYETRDSRLFKSNFEYIRRTIAVVFKSLILYKTKTSLSVLTMLLTIPGLSLLSRFFIPYFRDGSNPGNTQSLIVGIGYMLMLIFVLLFTLIKIGNIKEFVFLKRNLFTAKHS